MRYVVLKSAKICSHCHEKIEQNDIAIQSEAWFNLFYHTYCHQERFHGSLWHEPHMTATVARRQYQK